MILFCSLRGYIVLFGLNPKFIYNLSFIVASLLGLISIYIIVFMDKNNHYIELFKLSLIFFLIIIFYFIFQTYFSRNYSSTSFYLSYVFCLSIFFDRLTIKSRCIMIFLIYVFTSIGVYHSFIISLNGLDVLLNFNQKFRPNMEYYAHYNGFFRLGGYNASNHDTANILAIAGIFIAANILSPIGIYKKRSILILLFGLIALFLTISASNISVFIFCLTIMGLLFFRLKQKVYFILSLILFISLVHYSDFDFLFIFTNKFTDHGSTANNGMFNGLDYNSISDSIFSLIFGFCYELEFPVINTELALIKLLFSYGMIPFILFLYLSNYPILLAVLKSKKRFILIYAFPPLAAFLTLFHYGSVFRTTSLFTYILVYSLFLTYFKNTKYNYRILKTLN